MSKANPTLAEKTIQEIKQAALEMPESYKHVRRRQMISGDDLILTGIKKVKGEEPKPGVMYAVKMPVPRLINHEDEMIKLYAQRRYIGHDAAYKLVADYIAKTLQEINA